MNRYALGALTAALALGATATALAHHSFAAAYNMSESISIKGTIVEVRLTNPHSWFFLDVENERGELERWSFEAGTPSGMIRNGYKASELPPGTVVTISGFPARDPSQKVGMLRQLTTSSGRTYGMFGPQEGPGAR
jgi:hypothetical protein